MILEDLTLQESELFDKSVPGYHSPEDDESQLEKVNLRKTRLTLMQINKLRQMNDIRNFENREKVKVVQQQYGASSEEGGDDMGF